MRSQNSLFSFRSLLASTPSLLGKKHVKELIRTYADVERALANLRKKTVVPKDTLGLSINIHKLMRQLKRSKRQIERKIGNTLLLEKQHLKRRLRKFSTPRLKKPLLERKRH